MDRRPAGGRKTESRNGQRRKVNNNTEEEEEKELHNIKSASDISDLPELAQQLSRPAPAAAGGRQGWCPLTFISTFQFPVRFMCGQLGAETKKCGASEWGGVLAKWEGRRKREGGRGEEEGGREGGRTSAAYDRPTDRTERRTGAPDLNFLRRVSRRRRRRSARLSVPVKAGLAFGLVPKSGPNLSSVAFAI